MSVLIRELSEDEAKNKNCALSNKRVLGSVIVDENDMNQDTLFSAAGISLIKCPVKNSEFKSKRFYRFLDKFEVELVNKLKVSSSLGGSKDTLSNVAVQVAMTKVAYDMADYSDKIKKVLDRDFGNHPYDIYQIITRNTVLSDLVEDSMGYKSRLITYDELYNNLNYDRPDLNTNTGYPTSNTPSFMINNSFGRYWTMSAIQDYDNQLWVLDGNDGKLSDGYITSHDYAVRPVITIKKSALN